MKQTFVVAEMSANHVHDFQIALDTIHAAKEAGADAIKIQTYTADTLTLDCDKPEFMAETGGLWSGSKLYDLYQRAYTPWEWHQAIFDEAKRVGILCFSTPFDKTAVDLLERLENPIYKIASFEITDIPLIEYVASKGKPVIISTGVAMLSDIELALDVCRQQGNDKVTLLKCTSAYPAPIEVANLLTIPDMKKRFGVSVGLSDHTMGNDVAIAAVALGAKIVEKHFIIDRSIGGPDAAFSMNREEFAAMVKSIRNVEKALGEVNYPTDPEQIKGRQFCRSLYVVENMRAGDAITEKNVRSIRPGFGMHPKYLKNILGKKVKEDMKKGERIKWEKIESEIKK